jgi:hypothetical protein
MPGRRGGPDRRTSGQFRALMKMAPKGREMFADMIRRVAIAEARAQGADQGEDSGSSRTAAVFGPLLRAGRQALAGLIGRAVRV